MNKMHLEIAVNMQAKIWYVHLEVFHYYTNTGPHLTISFNNTVNLHFVMPKKLHKRKEAQNEY